MALTQISSNGIKDGEVKNADMADDAVGIAELSATGTASSSTFLRGDNSWATPTDTNTIYVHPNHSGEVTSTADGATVIADDVVDEANLKVSNSPTNGYFLSAQSGNTGGLTWAAASSSPDWQSFQGEMVGDQTIANTTWTRIKFNAENWDTDNNFDTTTDDWYYAAPAAGKYWYKVSLKINGTGATTELDVALYKSAGGTGTYTNQPKTHRWRTTPNGGAFMVQTTGLIELAASDRVAAYGWHNAGSDKILDDNWCLFEMFKLDGA